MKTHYKIALFSCLLSLGLQSCRDVQARRPIEKNSSESVNLSIENNRKRYSAEEKAIEKVITSEKKDYTRSSFGFYYRYITKIDSLKKMPKFGDEVTFEYNVVSLKGDTIYHTNELSPITKSLEREYGIFKGMRETLKLMKTGETLEVFYPSYMGYGYYGDQDRIGTNVPFKSVVTLLGINIKQEMNLQQNINNNKQ